MILIAAVIGVIWEALNAALKELYEQCIA